MKRVWLSERPGGAIDESILRAAAVALGAFACDGDAGRRLGDPVFEQVTEGRARNPGYSACGDLAHWVLECLGCRDEALVNRSDDGGRVPWRSGENLHAIVYSPYFRWASADARPSPGDILYLVGPEHVCVLEELDEAQGTIATFDYGKPGPSGSRSRNQFLAQGSQLIVGRRVLRGWFDISKVPLGETAIVPDGFEGWAADDCPYEEPVPLAPG